MMPMAIKKVKPNFLFFKIKQKFEKSVYVFV